MNIQVYPHRIILNKTNEVNTGEYNVNECTFEFSQEYEGLTKVAVFSLCDGTTKNVTILNNQCIIPVECLQETGQVQIGVYGYATQDNELVLRYSPTPQNFVVKLGSYKEGTQPVAPTPTDWEILVEQVNDIAEDVSSIHEDITGINGEINGINIDIRDLKDTKANINDLAAVAFTGEFSDLKNIPSYATTQQLNQEIQDRQDADVNLQSQIDAISVSSDVVDVVGTYQELLDYDTQHLKDNDIVKVLQDSTHSNALSYYRWDKETSTWSYVGSEGPFYTKSETDTLLNDKQDVIDIDNMLSSDLVDDTNSTNKFVTQADITNWNNKEDKSNKVTEINSSSTDTQYPSAKCVYDSQEEQNEQLAELEMLYNAFPTVSDEDTTIELNNTAKVKFREIDLKGNTSQVVIPEEQGTSVSNTSIYVSDVNTDKENTIELSGNTYQETTTGKNLLNYVDNLQSSISGITNTINSDGSITTTGIPRKNYVKVIQVLDLTDLLKDNTYYTISQTTPSDYVYAQANIRSTGGTYTYQNSKSGSLTFLVNKSSYDKYEITIQTTTTTVWGNNSLTITNYYQLEEGQSATTFEKFTYGASPNPSYPQNIEVVTGTQNVFISGKNIFNKTDYTTFGTTLTRNGNATFTTDTNKITITTGASSANSGVYIRPITDYIDNWKSNREYMVSFDVKASQELSFKYGMSALANDHIVTIGTTTTRLSVKQILYANSGFVFYSTQSRANDTIEISNIMVSLVDNTTFEPYHTNQVLPVNLGNIELCKIDTYQDRIYKQNDKWYLEKQINKISLNGSENWTLGSASSNDYYAFQKNGALNNANEPTIYCDNFTNIGYQSASTTNDFECVCLNSASLVNSYLRIWIKGSRLSEKTASAFKTWLSTHNTIVYYALATPTTTEITDTTLVNQLNALYNATIYPITNINTDTSNLLPYIDLHYNFVTPSPSPSRPSVVNVVKGNNTITISNSDNTESQVFPINLGDMELCKIGTYQDYIYENNGNWFKKNNVKVATDIIGSTSKTISDMVSNATVYSYCGGTVSGTTITYTSELLVANTIYYPTTTPTDTQITDTTLITQLNNIKKAYSYDTQTNISQTNTDKPFIIYAEAIRSLKNLGE